MSLSWFSCAKAKSIYLLCKGSILEKQTHACFSKINYFHNKWLSDLALTQKKST